MSFHGLNPPTPYRGTDPTLKKLNQLEMGVDQLLPAIMSGGALVGSGASFTGGDSIGSFQGGSSAGELVVELILQMLTAIAALEGKAGNSQALWTPFSSSTASSYGDTLSMPPGWGGSNGGSDSPPAPGSPPEQGPTPGQSSTPGESSSSEPPSGSNTAYAGNGTSEKYTVVNKTDHAENFTYTDRSGGSATLSLGRGQTGTIYASSSAIGDRITADGSTQSAPNDPKGNEELFENGATLDSGGHVQTPVTQNPDISAVDSNSTGSGTVDGDGNPIKMVVTLPDGRSAGDGQPIRAYQYSTDDQLAMGLAGTAESSMTITIS